jgi:hypothetical protein
MPAPHEFNPPPRELHPEFGYLCPTIGMRRTARVALASMAVGMVLGAAGVLALSPRAERDGQILDPTFAFAPSEPAGPLAVGKQPTLTPAGTTGQAMVGSEKPSSPAANKPCTEQTWPYLDAKCLKGNTSAVRDVRVLPADAAEPAAGETSATPGTAAAAATPIAAPAAKPRPRKKKPASVKRQPGGEPPAARGAFAFGGDRNWRGQQGWRQEPQRDFGRGGWGW